MPIISPIAFGSFADKLLRIYEPPLRERKTYQGMRRVLRNVVRLGELAPKTTADLSVEMVGEYIAARTKAVRVNTVIGELGYLKSACSYATENDWLERTPFRSRRLRLKKHPLLAKTHHSFLEVASILRYLEARSHCDWEGHRLYALASLIAYTGVRTGEALWAKPEDLDFEKGLFFVVPRPRLKTEGSGKPVPMAPELIPILKRWMGCHSAEWAFPSNTRKLPWVTGKHGCRASDQIRLAGVANGILGLTFKSLRHSWATHAEGRWGFSDEQIQRVLRHTNPFTQQHYRHADLPFLTEIGSRITFKASA